MDKRVTFRGWLLPALLIAPQVVISAIFFFYPAGQAIWQSFFIPEKIFSIESTIHQVYLNFKKLFKK